MSETWDEWFAALGLEFDAASAADLADLLNDLGAFAEQMQPAPFESLWGSGSEEPSCSGVDGIESGSAAIVPLRRQSRRTMTLGLGVVLGATLGTGVAAAANQLPEPAQRFVERLVGSEAPVVVVIKPDPELIGGPSQPLSALATKREPASLLPARIPVFAQPVEVRGPWRGSATVGSSQHLQQLYAELEREAEVLPDAVPEPGPASQGDTPQAPAEPPVLPSTPAVPPVEPDAESDQSIPDSPGRPRSRDPQPPGLDQDDVTATPPESTVPGEVPTETNGPGKGQGRGGGRDQAPGQRR